MNTNQDTTITNEDALIDIKPLKQADVVQIIRTAESLDDAVNKMNGLAANGWLTLWDNATHPDGTSYRDLPAWKEATKTSVELVDELKAATKASESEINSLKERVAELQSHLSSQVIEITQNDVTLESYAHKVAELQADNERLRDALEIARDYQFDAVNEFHVCYAGYKEDKHKQYDEDLENTDKALSSTATQSLAQHDNEVIERVALAIENAEGELKYLPEYVALVRGMKVTPRYTDA